jgi:hypothetical protein
MNDNALQKLDMAQHALAECKTAMEAKQIADVAEAARVYLERTNASTETVNRATEIRLLAERQMGAFLKTMPKNTGSKGIGPIAVNDYDRNQTLSELGIKKQQSSDSQKLADISDQEFHERMALAKASGKLSTASILKKSRRVKNDFNFTAWKKQAKSVVTSWLQSVPDSSLTEAARFLSELPETIIHQIK